MKNNKKGFTLIELLVVIAIIGLLSTLAVVSLNNARIKSRDARRQSDLKQISTAMELYMSQVDSYPTNSAACAAGEPGQVAGAEAAGALEPLCGGAGMSICSDANADGDCEDSGDNTYLQAIPTEPTVGNTYSYEGDGTTYCISAHLEGGTAGTSDYFVCMNGSCYTTGAACTAI